MQRDELEAFRAKHPSVVEAIQSCDRPDWALQIAFDAAPDRKVVIRYGTNIIPALRDESDIPKLIKPPSVIESIEVYADNTDAVSAVTAKARALILGTWIAVPLAYVLNRFVWVGMYGHRSVFRLMLAISIPLFIVLVRMTFGWMVRRRASRLDDESAFAIVVDRIARAADKHPLNVPKTMRFLRRNLISIFEAAPR